MEPKQETMNNDLTLFVSNIPFDLTADNIHERLNNFNIKNIRLIMKDPKISKGFGYITLTNQTDYENLLKSTTVINGRRLKFSPYQSKQKYYKVFILNVPDAMTEQQIYDEFSKFGSVDTVVKFNLSSRLKGIASVTYDNFNDFNKVISMKEIKLDENTTLNVSDRYELRQPVAPQVRNQRQSNISDENMRLHEIETEINMYEKSDETRKQILKLLLLQKLADLTKNGINLTQNYDINSNYQTMLFEYELHKFDLQYNSQPKRNVRVYRPVIKRI